MNTPTPKARPLFHRVLIPALMAASAVCLSFAEEGGAGKLRIEKVDAKNADATLRWINETSGPVARIGEILRGDGSRLATVSGGWSSEALLLEVEVQDAEHMPAPSVARLWAADSVELRIDTSAEESASRAEWKLIFGLLKDGPAAVGLDGPRKLSAEELAPGVQIDRLERTGRTFYRVRLPWSLLNARPGARPTMRLGVQVNDLARGQREKTVHLWQGASTGRTGGEARPTRRVILGEPAKDFVALDWDVTEVWAAGETNVLSVGVRGQGPTVLRVGDSSVEIPRGEGWNFWRVIVPPERDGEKLRAQIEGAPVAEATQTVVPELRQRISARVKELLAKDDVHPIFRRHLESVDGLVEVDWQKLPEVRAKKPADAAESVGYYRDILAGLNADAGEWAAFLDGRRSLVMAYRSDHDGTLQYYMFGLPRDWDPAKSYPLFFELHGAGNPHPLNTLGTRLGAKPRAQGLAGYETPKVYAEIERSGYWVHPFGRGNSGYRGVGRIDVLEAYDDAHRLVKIDPNRRYLYGFSMGGAGTFSLAMRTPSRWAAASSFAGGSARGEAGSDLPGNYVMVPYKLLSGTEDTRAMQGYASITEEMKRRGIKIEARTIQGLGHFYTGEQQKEMIDWLKTHVRRRPEKFVFVADENLTSECWGVKLEVNEAARTHARVEARIEGNTVHLTTTGTERITLDFSEPDGLGLSGEVVVRWNGREAYRGPATAEPLVLSAGTSVALNSGAR